MADRHRKRSHQKLLSSSICAPAGFYRATSLANGVGHVLRRMAGRWRRRNKAAGESCGCSRLGLAKNGLIAQWVVQIHERQGFFLQKHTGADAPFGVTCQSPGEVRFDEFQLGQNQNSASLPSSLGIALR